MTNQYFDINRLSKFVVRQSTLYINQMLLAIAVIFGILFTVTLFTAYFNPEKLFAIWGFYIAVYFIGGFILSSAAFSELNSPHSGYAFLTLPVSSLEKLLGAWFITSIVYTIIYFLVVAAMYFVVGIIMPDVQLSGVWGTNPEAGSAASQFGEIVLNYMVAQPLFLLGASTFIKHNLLKTLLSAFIFWIGVGLYAALIFWMLFGSGKAFQPGTDISIELKDMLEFIFKGVIYVVLPLFLLTVSYFKIKERQV
jgi:hypothetical protein